MSEGKIGAIDGDALIKFMDSDPEIPSSFFNGPNGSAKFYKHQIEQGRFALTAPPRDLTPEPIRDEKQEQIYSAVQAGLVPPASPEPKWIADRTIVGFVPHDQVINLAQGVRVEARHLLSEVRTVYEVGLDRRETELNGNSPAPPRDLTPSEALEEARKRWGRKGTAQYDPTYAPAFRVGEYEPTINIFRIKGEALSFRECFVKADEAQKESK